MRSYLIKHLKNIKNRFKMLNQLSSIHCFCFPGLHFILGLLQAPSNGHRRRGSLSLWAIAGEPQRHEALPLHRARCAPWRRPSRLLLWQCLCLHLSPSFFMILSPPSIFPLITSQYPCLSPSLWSLAIITELMQVLPLAQLRPTPNIKTGLHHQGMTWAYFRRFVHF